MRQSAERMYLCQLSSQLTKKYSSFYSSPAVLSIIFFHGYVVFDHMNKGNIISIVLATIAIVKIDFIFNLSYWGAFELGVKIVIFALPVLLLLSVMSLLVLLGKLLWGKWKEKKPHIVRRKRLPRSKRLINSPHLHSLTCC